jgi:hypothetical protein
MDVLEKTRQQAMRVRCGERMSPRLRSRARRCACVMTTTVTLMWRVGATWDGAPPPD